NALRTRPGDLHLLMALGNSYPGNRPEGAAESVRWFQAAVAAHPGNVAVRNILGYVLWVKGDTDGAIAAYHDAIRLDPNFAFAHHNLGFVLWEKGNREGAIAAFRDAIHADPNYLEARFKLGGALWEKGDRPGAVAEYREAARRHPNDPAARSNLGFVLHHTGQWDDALAEYQEELRLDRNHDLAHSNLAVLLASGPERLRDGKRAVEHASRGCVLTNWQRPSNIAALAVAYAEVGEFDKAIKYQKQALEDKEYAKKYGAGARERLQLYEQKMPYRDPALAPLAVAPTPREVKR